MTSSFAPSGYSIIIPTYNRARLLSRALESIQRMDPPRKGRVEVVVVDNNCTDDTREVVAGFNGRYPIEVVSENCQGLNNARNRGARQASHEFLVYLDDDMEVSRGWLTACESALETNSVHAVCGPVYPRFQSSVAPWMSARLRASVSSEYSLRGSDVKMLAEDSAGEIPGCNFGVWKRVVLLSGGFHPQLDRSSKGMLAGGDSEFGERLGRLGGRILYVPGCRIEHFISDSKTSFPGMMRRWHGLGRTSRVLARLRRNEQGGKEVARRVRLMVSLSIRSIGSFVRGDVSDGVERIAWVVRHFGYVFAGHRKIQPVAPGCTTLDETQGVSNEH